MKTKKQEELVNTFLSDNMNEQTHLYREIAVYLSEIGYNPKKQRSSIVFNHDKHNKQIAKFGIVRTKDKSPYFALRFAACKGYSGRFAELVSAVMEKEECQTANCIAGKCDYCQGEPVSHVYVHTNAAGETITRCGASPITITDLTEGDIDEIKKLIWEQHVYLMKHEAGIEV
jgi:hypothetical protein